MKFEFAKAAGAFKEGVIDLAQDWKTSAGVVVAGAVVTSAAAALGLGVFFGAAVGVALAKPTFSAGKALVEGLFTPNQQGPGGWN